MRTVSAHLAGALTAAACAPLTLVAPAAAHATPPIGASTVVLSRQTVGGTDYMVAEITLAPNGSTGFHTHQGEVYGIVKSGVLTHYDAHCRQDGVYPAGSPITDPTGADHVHIGRNLGPVPLVLDITYVDPAGAPTSDSAPDPGCDFA